MAKDPAFLFYSKDWLEGTAELTPSEKGVMIDLLCYQHQKGGIPSDETKLARLSRLSVSEFKPIWEILKEKFIPNGDRLVNQKLIQVVKERVDRSEKNRITGTFASILRLANISKKEYAIIKNKFKIEDFINIPTERLTDCLTIWFNDCLKSIVNANEDVNAKEYVNTIEDRKATFANEISMVFGSKYQPSTLLAFCKYWTEHSPNGKLMRFEMEKVFDRTLRLATWKSNETKFNQNGNNTKEARAKSVDDLANDARETLARSKPQGNY